jgi:HSP20 family protein
MASRARWDPFREIASLQSELGRLASAFGEGEGVAVLVPPADVWETDNEVVYAFDLPGVPEDKVSIELEDTTLTVTAERERPADVARDRLHRSERRFGTFTRTIAVPQGTSENDISANYANGVLELRVAKQQAPSPRRIQIGVSSQSE